MIAPLLSRISSGTATEILVHIEAFTREVMEKSTTEGVFEFDGREARTVAVMLSRRFRKVRDPRAKRVESLAAILQYALDGDWSYARKRLATLEDPS